MNTKVPYAIKAEEWWKISVLLVTKRDKLPIAFFHPTSNETIINLLKAMIDAIVENSFASAYGYSNKSNVWHLEFLAKEIVPYLTAIEVDFVKSGYVSGARYFDDAQHYVPEIQQLLGLAMLKVAK